jgi:hypothetical protein
MVLEDNQFYCPDCGAVNDKVGKPKREFSDDVAEKVFKKIKEGENEKTRKTEKDDDDGEAAGDEIGDNAGDDDESDLDKEFFA